VANTFTVNQTLQNSLPIYSIKITDNASYGGLYIYNSSNTITCTLLVIDNNFYTVSRRNYAEFHNQTSNGGFAFSVNYNFCFFIRADQRVSIGNEDIASAKLSIASTTQGFLPPRMTTTQRDAISSPAAGLIIYNSTTNKLQCYNGTIWNDLF
jgi:hypothetical protein